MMCSYTIKGVVMKVLISQPMKGLSNEQIKLNRENVVKEFHKLGYEVLDSVFAFEDIEGVKTKPLFYLAKSLELIAHHADTVYFMKGWENARGCKVEHDCCIAYDVPVLYED